MITLSRGRVFAARADVERAGMRAVSSYVFTLDASGRLAGRPSVPSASPPNAALLAAARAHLARDKALGAL